MSQEIKDRIESLVGSIHDEKGQATMRVGLIRDLYNQRFGDSLSRNEVELACDELVEEDRLQFVMDSGKSGRRYASMKVDERKVQRLRDDQRSPKEDN